MKIAKYEGKDVTIIRTGGKNTRVEYTGEDLPSFKVANSMLSALTEVKIDANQANQEDKDAQPEVVSLEEATEQELTQEPTQYDWSLDIPPIQFKYETNEDYGHQDVVDQLHQ